MIQFLSQPLLLFRYFMSSSISKVFSNTLVISSLIHFLVTITLFSFLLFVNFPNFFLTLVFSFTRIGEYMLYDCFPSVITGHFYFSFLKFVLGLLFFPFKITYIKYILRYRNTISMLVLYVDIYIYLSTYELSGKQPAT